MSNERLVHTGIVFPREILKKLDERRGRYYSRNKYLLKIVEGYLDKEEQEAAMIVNAIEKAK